MASELALRPRTGAPIDKAARDSAQTTANVAADTRASSGRSDGDVCSRGRVQGIGLDCIVQSGPVLPSRAGLRPVYRTYPASNPGERAPSPWIAVRLHFDCSFGEVVRGWGGVLAGAWPTAACVLSNSRGGVG